MSHDSKHRATAANRRIVRPADPGWRPKAEAELAHLRLCWGRFHLHEIVRQVMHALPSGSYLVLCHVTADEIAPAIERRVRSLYDRASAPGTPRAQDEIARFFDGCEMLEPGLVSVSSWRNGLAIAEPERVIFYAGVGTKL